MDGLSPFVRSALHEPWHLRRHPAQTAMSERVKAKCWGEILGERESSSNLRIEAILGNLTSLGFRVFWLWVVPGIQKWEDCIRRQLHILNSHRAQACRRGPRAPARRGQRTGLLKGRVCTSYQYGILGACFCVSLFECPVIPKSFMAGRVNVAID